MRVCCVGHNYLQVMRYSSIRLSHVRMSVDWPSTRGDSTVTLTPRDQAEDAALCQSMVRMDRKTSIVAQPAAKARQEGSRARR